MELRKAEQEIDRLKSEWKSLRRKKARYEGDADGEEVDLSVLPPWKDLMSKVVDADIFPKIEPANEVAVHEISRKEAANHDGVTKISDAEEDAGYSEWGMLVTGSSAEQKRDETPIVKPFQAAVLEKAEPIPPDEESDEDCSPSVNASPDEVYFQLQSFLDSFKSMQPKIEKFTSRLTERDPVTKKPRYGERAIARVKKIIRVHKALEFAVTAAFDTNGVIGDIHDEIKRHEERLEAKAKAIETTQQLEARRKEQERLEADKLAEEELFKAELEKKKEAEKLAQLAEEARLRRMEEEQRAIDEEAEADRTLLASVPVKGADGVRMQIDRMRTALKSDKKALDIALGSLYQLFDQIVRKPEEVNFRRIRRDHPKFIEDIGQHVGGKEVLIAAGFHLVKLDDVPCFFSKEPHIESDMDGWSDWFDGLKKTLEVIEQEMMI